jgi:hypothetical protein
MSLGWRRQDDVEINGTPSASFRCQLELGWQIRRGDQSRELSMQKRCVTQDGLHGIA